MKTPILRLTIGQNVTLSGSFINHNDKVMPFNKKCSDENSALQYVQSMRDSDNEFQLIIVRQTAVDGV